MLKDKNLVHHSLRGADVSYFPPFVQNVADAGSFLEFLRL